MTQNRAKKKGFVYLMKSKKAINGLFLMKYGCTSRSIESRLKANSRKINSKMEVVSFFHSEDIYKSENKIKWKLRDHNKDYVSQSEFFTCNEAGLDSVKLMFVELGE